MTWEPEEILKDRQQLLDKLFYGAMSLPEYWRLQFRRWQLDVFEALREAAA